MTNSTNIFTFKSFSKIPGLVHGFSTRKFGTMRPDHVDSERSLDSFSKSLKINYQNIIKMHQVHSSNIQWVSHKQKGQVIDQTDGLFTQEKNLYLSVLAADCLPVLIFDTRKKYPGAIHAGWKGIYNKILKTTIKELISKGSKPDNLLIGIGPCIQPCCYNITKERADMFIDKFPQFSNFLEKRDGMTFLNLVSIAKQQLHAAGIPPGNIEDCGICASDNTDRFFSFRREGKNFGEFIGIIGLV